MKYTMLKVEDSYLYQIMAIEGFSMSDGIYIAGGAKGGFIEKEENLSQYGTCWIEEGVMIQGNACVHGNAHITGSINISGNVEIDGDSTINVSDSNILSSIEATENSYVRITDNALLESESMIKIYASEAAQVIIKDEAWLAAININLSARNSSRIEFNTCNIKDSVGITTYDTSLCRIADSTRANATLNIQLDEGFKCEICNTIINGNTTILGDYTIIDSHVSNGHGVVLNGSGHIHNSILHTPRLLELSGEFNMFNSRIRTSMHLSGTISNADIIKPHHYIYMNLLNTEFYIIHMEDGTYRLFLGSTVNSTFLELDDVELSYAVKKLKKLYVPKWWKSEKFGQRVLYYTLKVIQANIKAEENR